MGKIHRKMGFLTSIFLALLSFVIFIQTPDYTEVLANGYGNLHAVKDRFKTNYEGRGYSFYEDVMSAEYIPDEYTDLHTAIGKFRFQDVNIYMSPTFGQGTSKAGVYIHSSGGDSSSLDRIILLKPDSENIYNTLFHEYAHHLMNIHNENPHLLEVYNNIGLDDEVITDFVAVFIQNEQRHGRYMDDILDTYYSAYLRDVDFVDTFNGNDNLNRYVTYLLNQEFPDGFNLLRNNPNPAVPEQEVEYFPEVVVPEPEVEVPVIEIPVETPVEEPTVETQTDETPNHHAPIIDTEIMEEDKRFSFSIDSLEEIYLYWVLLLIVLSFITMVFAIINVS